jgi:hypothetical protein
MRGPGLRGLLLWTVVSAGIGASAGTYDAAPDSLAAIRQNFQEVTRLVSEGKLLQVRREFSCPNVPDALRVIWKDGSGQVRKYMIQGGTSDQAATVSQFYDAAGHLSFALIESGAVNGTQTQTRLYYGAAGNVIRHDEKQVHGPGYPFGPQWQWVVHLPEVAFNAPPPCSVGQISAP